MTSLREIKVVMAILFFKTRHDNIYAQFYKILNKVTCLLNNYAANRCANIYIHILLTYINIYNVIKHDNS